MKEIKFTVAVDGTAVLSDQFVQDMRDAANEPDATPFLRSIADFTEDEFVEALVRQNVRTTVRLALRESFAEVGQGLRLAPAEVLPVVVQPIQIED